MTGRDKNGTVLAPIDRSSLSQVHPSKDAKINKILNKIILKQNKVSKFTAIVAPKLPSNANIRPKKTVARDSSVNHKVSDKIFKTTTTDTRNGLKMFMTSQMPLLSHRHPSPSTKSKQNSSAIFDSATNSIGDGSQLDATQSVSFAKAMTFDKRVEDGRSRNDEQLPEIALKSQ